MNRIQPEIELNVESLLPSPIVAAAAAEPSADLESTHCIFTPLHYERHYAYPLVVWLHGADGDEREVTKVMPLVSKRNYVGVGPRGTVGPDELRTFGWSQEPDHIVLAEQRVMAAVAAARRWLNIAPARIYLAGFGSGGTMAFRLALNQPHVFAGVASFGGLFPTTLRPLAQLHAARRLNLLLATGRDSQEYPQARVCDDLRLFHTAGLSICLRQYPCGDDLTTSMLSDMDRWIMDQLTAPAPVAADEPSPRAGGH
jgi:phospholipase/carboxylesterase